MEIKDLKSNLKIADVLAHYGLIPNKNKMLRCPWHNDKTPSLQIYHETNTWCCFSSNCKAGTGDTLQMIENQEGKGKHQAIMKAKEILGVGVETLNEIFTKLKRNLKRSEKARQYLKGRGLTTSNVGYNSPPRRGVAGSYPHLKSCLVFPLKSAKGNIVSLYGRSIYDRKEMRHFYLKNRSGLYPHYPRAETKKLILTESIIDAATLLEQVEIKQNYEVLALYGTNGLTEEHEKAIANLKELKEIILFFDGDEAGRKASEKYGKELKDICKISNVETPTNDDINGLIQGHEPSILLHHIEERNVFSFSIENKKQKEESTFDTSNPHRIIYRTDLAIYEVKGGIRYGIKDLDSMKITLVIENGEGRRSRNKLDMYEDKQIEKIARMSSERLGLRADLLELDMFGLANKLERYQEECHQKSMEEPSMKNVAVSPVMQEKCRTFLSKPKLLERINKLLEKCGIVGEEKNRILLFVVASSYKMNRTLHALIQGSSGSGKTRLLQVVSDCMPSEDMKRYTRVTDGSFYNQGEYFFKNKLLCFEDIDGLKEDALLAVRELQSNEILITSTSMKNESGNIQGGERIVRGPIASLSCTTKAEVYEDNISRCFSVAVDESKGQDLLVMEYQNNRSAGILDGSKEQEIKSFLQDCIRMLGRYEVVNPFANKIALPKEAHKIRRLNELYQSFVRQITLLNQYRRKKDKKGRLITEKEDLELACEILFEAIILKVDELDGSLRNFFEKVKRYVETKGKDYEFDRFEIRKMANVSKTQQHRFMRQLVELEYVRQRGFANRGYKYRIQHWDDMGALRAKIRKSLNGQLEKL